MMLGERCSTVTTQQKGSQGRGLGLASKMRSYRLQNDGPDTIDANTTLGFDDDERDDGIDARMPGMLNCTRIVLLLIKDPAKLDGRQRRDRHRRPDAARSADQCRQPQLYDRQGRALGTPTRMPALLAIPSWATKGGPKGASTVIGVDANALWQWPLTFTASFRAAGLPVRLEETSTACRGPPSAPVPTCCVHS